MTFHADMVGDDLHIARTQVSTGDPDGVVTAGIIGELYWDSTNNRLYVAEAADDSSWADAIGEHDELSEILANGNITDGTDLVISADDDLLVTDHMTVGSADAPAAGSSIDLTGTDAALLPNRLTTTQRDALTAVESMLIYNTTAQELQFYNGAAWQLSGTGDVVGPSSAISGAMAFFDGTTGRLLNDIPNITTDGTNLSLEDSITLGFGDADDLTIFHNGTDSRINSTTGDLLIDNQNATGSTIFQLGSDNINTSFQIQNDSGADIFLIESDGTDTFWQASVGDIHVTSGSAGEFIFDDDSIHAGISAAEALQMGHTAAIGFINSIGTGSLEFQHDGTTVLTLSDTGKLSIPLDLSTPQFTIGANDDFQFFHNGTTSHIQNFVGDLEVLAVTGDVLVETGTNGHFLFTTNEFRGGVSTSEYLSIGHDGTNSIINAVGDGDLELQHEGTAIATLSDASVLDFAVASTISTTAGDLTLSPAGDLLTTSDLDFTGGGNILIKRSGQTVVTIDSGGDFNTAGDLYTFDVIAADFSGNRLDVTQEVVAPEISISETFTFHEGSTQHVAAVPDLRSGRISSALLNHIEDISTEEANPQHIYMRVDGLKLYVVGETGNGVDEYDMSTPWDTSTMSHIRFFSVSSQDTGPKGIFFKPDGLRMYIAGAQNESIYQYDLSTAWNISTAVYNNDFVDVSTDTINPASIVFKPDGSAFFVVAFNAGTNALTHYGMSTLWDVSTASFLNGFSPTEPTDLSGVGIRNDGALLYLTSTSDDEIYEYFLGTPWNTTGNTAFLGSRIMNGDGSVSPRGVFFSPFYDKMYFADPGADSIFEYNMGIVVEGAVKSGLANAIDIYSFADLDEHAVSAVWTISEDTTLNWIGDVEASVRFSIDSGITLNILGDDRATAKYEYDGSDVTHLFSGEGSVLVSGMENLTSTEGANLFNMTGGGTVTIRDCKNITGWKLGSIDGPFFVTNADFVDVDNGFFLTQATLVTVTDVVQRGATLGAHLFKLNTNDPASLISFTNVFGQALSASGSLFHFETQINNQVVINVRGCSVASDGDGNPIGYLFEPATGGSDAFTAASDTSPATGTITTSASNGSGGTTITSTTTYFEDEEVTISGATASDGTYQIFNVVAGTSFDIIRAFTAEDTTGSVDTNRLAITLAGGHSVGTGDSMKIVDANSYNGFYTALDVVSNSLIINGVEAATATDTGNIFDDIGLDETDPRVSAIGNGAFIDSQSIISAHVKDNATTQGTITNGVFKDMVFGTAGSALLSSGTMQGWKLVDDVNGTFEYIERKPLKKDIKFEATGATSSGNTEFIVKLQIDTGSGFGDLPYAMEVEANLGTSSRILSGRFPVEAVRGNQIKAVMTRDSGSNGLTWTHAGFSG